MMTTINDWQRTFGGQQPLPYDYARDNEWIAGPRAEYADAEAARQDATAPHEVPQCVADRAAERRVIAGKLMTARWMMQEVERMLEQPNPFNAATRR